MKASRLGLLHVLTILAGCSSSPWTRHDASLYTVMKEPSPATVAQHAQLLEQTIQQANQANVRPPAGVCAEYAYYLAKLGRGGEAKKFLDLEARHYPEAKTFIKALERFLEGVTPIAGGTEVAK
jgi:hypothetical protein